jgi:hypothetical protein
MCVPLPHEQDTNSADGAYGIACLTILEIASALVFSINRYHCFAWGDGRLDHSVDVIELRIPVGMMAAFMDFAVGLAIAVRVAQQVGEDAPIEVAALFPPSCNEACTDVHPASSHTSEA